MDCGRLQEACVNGDAAALRGLLQVDRLLLHRAAASASAADGPLHVAALLGHADLAAEILGVKPELARGRNARGSYPLHLASANGHRRVVEELLKADAGLCLLRDGGGHLPLHTAVLNGRVDITEVLVEASRGSARELTWQGESVLHLGVRINCVEVVQLLVERLDLGEDAEFLNLKDERGNTALHLATARRQAQMLEFLASTPGVDMNARNQRGATALDVLLELPCEPGDLLLLGDTLFAAGSRPSRPVPHVNRRGRDSETAEGTVTNPRRRRRRTTRHPAAKSSDKWVDYTPNTVMLVAVLIATVTFQAGIQPPGGFRQEDVSYNITVPGIPVAFVEMVDRAGEAVLSRSLGFRLFMLFNMGALFASLTIILLLICVIPHKRKKLTRGLACIMWLAVLATGMAFTFGVSAIFPDGIGFDFMSGLMLWLPAFFVITLLWLMVRFVVRLLRALFGKKDPPNTARSGDNGVTTPVQP